MGKGETWFLFCLIFASPDSITSSILMTELIGIYDLSTDLNSFSNLSKHNLVIFEPIFRTHLYKSLNTKGLFRTHGVQRLILMV